MSINIDIELRKKIEHWANIVAKGGEYSEFSKAIKKLNELNALWVELMESRQRVMDIENKIEKIYPY